MRRLQFFPAIAAVLVFTATAVPGRTDTLELTDGTIIQNCYIKDEGIRLLVWLNFKDVGGPAKIYPRHIVKTYKVERDEQWDTHPNLPDLSVTFIEMTPKLAGLHGRVAYDHLGRPSPAPCDVIPDIGDRKFTHPEEALKSLRFTHKPGEEITFTGHVKNLGFATAKPFQIEWLVDGRRVKTERCDKSLKEMEETTFVNKYAWRDGMHTIGLRILTDQPEIATINNEGTDPMWGWGYTFVVHKGRVDAWHQNRTAYGTFSFEDFYRWHLDIMNLLFENSIYPSAPNGIKARVRLDRIVYADDMDKAIAGLVNANGVRYDQGGWNWINDEDRNKKWDPPTKEWRNQTEWSLPHELGHQLGLVDYYAVDYGGTQDHVMPDNGEPVTHFQNRPTAMMHWHGPHLFNEVDAGYLNATWNKPRGHFGDYYFAIPREVFVEITDVNGDPLPDAKVEIYQRGSIVAPNGKAGSEFGVTYYPVIEDGNFVQEVSKDPVIVGKTNSLGVIRLPNRPVDEVVTFNGFHRRPNPFGNINVVGQRALLLVKVTKDDASMPAYYWIEACELNIAYFRGNRDRCTVRLESPFGSADSPPAPTNVKVERIDDTHARVTWDPPAEVRDQHYLDKVIGYTVYRRIGNNGLNDRPYFPVATVGPNVREVVVDLSQFPEDTYWYSRADRFAVATIGELSRKSGMNSVILPPKQ